MSNKDVYLYKFGKNLYVNLTNKCTCRCTFCLRQTKDEMENSGSLWLQKEPTAEQVIAAFNDWDLSQFDEVVFCGFGEPTERLDTLLTVADYVHNTLKMPVRVNTNGLANLSYGRDITPLFEGKVDAISISLNTPNKERYYQLTRNKFGIDGFDGLLDFVKKVKTHVPRVILSTVSTTLTAEEEAECQKICDDLGVTYRIRPFE